MAYLLVSSPHSSGSMSKNEEEEAVILFRVQAEPERAGLWGIASDTTRLNQ
jgi:hypothetical protein